jgi:glycosyltransferase 2 family protein
MKLKRYFWPVVATATIVLSVWLLLRELHGLSLEKVGDSLAAIPALHWVFAAISTLVAYAALAGYDRVALLHLGRRIDWLFITVCSFTTYALSHNIGASVVSGGVVRYRAYSTKGLSPAEIGLLVAFCSFTFILGTVTLIGFVLVLDPDIVLRFGDLLPLTASRATGVFLLLLVALYLIGSLLRLRPLHIGRFAIVYPSLHVTLSQIAVAASELLGAAGIIYFALPEAGNPGYFIVLGIFLMSFSAALISHVPGGLGVLELVFVMGLPDMAGADVIAALLVFRLFYLIVPLVMALVVVLLFERSRFRSEQAAEKI